MIDWTQVAQLRDEVGPEDFEEVVDLFFEEVDQVITRLDASSDQLAEDVHFIKGSALNIGFQALARLCQDAEDLCARAAGDQVKVPEILSTYAGSKQVFGADLPAFLAGKAGSQTNL